MNWWTAIRAVALNVYYDAIADTLHTESVFHIVAVSISCKCNQPTILGLFLLFVIDVWFDSLKNNMSSYSSTYVCLCLLFKSRYNMTDTWLNIHEFFLLSALSARPHHPRFCHRLLPSERVFVTSNEMSKHIK